MPEPLAEVLTAYYATLDRYRLLTYGQQVVQAVTELERPELAGQVHARLRHLGSMPGWAELGLLGAKGGGFAAGLESQVLAPVRVPGGSRLARNVHLLP